MQKIRIIALALAAGLLFTLNAQASLTTDDVPRMSIEELKQKMDTPDLIIIDVRAPHDWEVSTTMIKGSIREDASETASWIAKYPPDKTLVFYCS